MAHNRSNIASSLELYQKIFAEQLVREIYYLIDVAYNRALPRSDFTDKLIDLLNSTAQTAAAPIPGASHIPTLIQNILGAVQEIAQSGAGAIGTVQTLRGEKNKYIASVSRLGNIIDQTALEVMAKEIARAAAYQYEYALTHILSDEVEASIIPFAMTGVRRALAYLARNKEPLTVESLLRGLIEGQSGGGIEAWVNQGLSTKLKIKHNKMTSEGIYRRSGMQDAVTGKTYILDKKHSTKNKESKVNVFTKFNKDGAGPKYGYMRVNPLIPAQYGYQESKITVSERENLNQLSMYPVTEADIKDYLQTIHQPHETNQDKFIDYLKKKYPVRVNWERAIFTGTLSDLDFTDANFDGCDFSHTQFNRCTFNKTQFKKGYLQHCDFATSTISSLDLAETDLSYASLPKKDLSQSRLFLAKLNFTQLENSVLSNQIEGAQWYGAIVDGCTTANEQGLTIIQQQLINQNEKNIEAEKRILDELKHQKELLSLFETELKDDEKKQKIILDTLEKIQEQLAAKNHYQQKLDQLSKQDHQQNDTIKKLQKQLHAVNKKIDELQKEIKKQDISDKLRHYLDQHFNAIIHRIEFLEQDLKNAKARIESLSKQENELENKYEQLQNQVNIVVDQKQLSANFFELQNFRLRQGIRENHSKNIKQLFGGDLDISKNYISINLLEDEKDEKFDQTLNNRFNVESKRSDMFELQPTSKKRQPLLVENLFQINAENEQSGSLEWFGFNNPQPRLTQSFVLLQGAAGAGKSLLAQHICYQWATGKWFQQYEWVFLFKLRDLNDFKGSLDIKTLLQQSYWQGKLTEREWNQLYDHLTESSRQNKILIVLDGYDEANASLTKFVDHFVSINQHESWHTLVTTRPYDLSGLPSKRRDVEVIGFDEKSIELYVRQFPFSEDNQAQKANELLSKILSDNTLLNIAHLPLCLNTLCGIYDQAPDTFAHGDITMTQLYQIMERGISLHRQENNKRQMIVCSTSDLVLKSPQEDSLLQRFLGRLAFLAMRANVLSPLISEATTKQALTNFYPQEWDNLQQLMYAHGLVKQSSITSTSLEFLHFTFQEYYAGKYAAYVLRMGQQHVCYAPVSQFIADQKNDPRYQNMLWFLAGCLRPTETDDQEIVNQKKRALKAYQALLNKPPIDLLGHYSVCLQMRCVSEAGMPEDWAQNVTKQLLKIFHLVRTRFLDDGSSGRSNAVEALLVYLKDNPSFLRRVANYLAYQAHDHNMRKTMDRVQLKLPLSQQEIQGWYDVITIPPYFSGFSAFGDRDRAISALSYMDKPDAHLVETLLDLYQQHKGKYDDDNLFIRQTIYEAWGRIGLKNPKIFDILLKNLGSYGGRLDFAERIAFFALTKLLSQSELLNIPQFRLFKQNYRNQLYFDYFDVDVAKILFKKDEEYIQLLIKRIYSDDNDIYKKLSMVDLLSQLGMSHHLVLLVIVWLFNGPLNTKEKVAMANAFISIGDRSKEVLSFLYAILKSSQRPQAISLASVIEPLACTLTQPVEAFDLFLHAGSASNLDLGRLTYFAVKAIGFNEWVNIFPKTKSARQAFIAVYGMMHHALVNNSAVCLHEKPNNYALQVSLNKTIIQHPISQQHAKWFLRAWADLKSILYDMQQNYDIPFESFGKLIRRYDDNFKFIDSLPSQAGLFQQNVHQDQSSNVTNNTSYDRKW